MYKIKSIPNVSTNFLIALNAPVVTVTKPRDWIRSVKWGEIAWVLFTHKSQLDKGAEKCNGSK